MKNNTTPFALYNKVLRLGGAALLFIALCILFSCDSSTAKQYTVIFDSNSGTLAGEAIHTQAVLEGTAVVDPGTPVRDGYYFLGWFTEAEGGSGYSFGSPVTGNIILYAHWTESNHSVTYHVLVKGEDKSSDYSLPASSAQHGANINQTSLPSISISDSNLTLVGWSTSKDNYLPIGAEYTVTGNTDLYAVVIDKSATGTVNVGGGTMKYSYDDETNGYSVCSDYDDMPSGAISIPSTTAIPVTAIANRAFSESVDNHNTIGAEITSIHIPSSVKIIYDNAFREVDKLETVSFAENSQLMEIKTYVFYNCTSLSSIKLPESLEIIDRHAFTRCTGLGTLTIPSNVHTIGENVFEGLTEDQTIIIKNPEFTPEIYFLNWDRGWVYDCKAKILDANGNKVDADTILSQPTPDEPAPDTPAPDTPAPEEPTPEEPTPDTGTPGAQYNVTYSVLVEGAESTDDTIYSGLPGAEVKTYGDTIAEPSFTLVDNATYAFVGWSTDSVNYTDVEFPYTVKGDTTLYAVLATKTETGYTLNTNGGTIYFTYDDSTGGYSVGSKKGEYPSGELVIPRSIGGAPVTKIADNAFGESGLLYNMEARANITSVTIPDTVTYIGQYAFAFLKAASITIPSNVEYIANYAFYVCESLTTIEFAENSKLKTIGSWAFNYCGSFKGITIPASVETIGKEAFTQCNAIDNVTFAENSKLTSIGDRAFAELYNIKEITIPKGVTSMGEGVFSSWNDSQTIVLLFADETSIPSGWSEEWDYRCNAIIEYTT